MKIFYLFNNKIKGIKYNKINDYQILQKLWEKIIKVYKVKRLVDNNIFRFKKVKLLNLSDKEKLYNP